MPSLSARRKRKTSLLDLEERPSVSASVSKSRSSKLTSDSSKPPIVADVVDSVVVVAAVETVQTAATDHPVVAEESFVDVVIEAKAVVVVTEEPLVDPTEEITAAHLSTRTTPVRSQAWVHRCSETHDLQKYLGLRFE